MTALSDNMKIFEHLMFWLDPYDTGPWYFNKKWIMALFVAAVGALLYFYGLELTDKIYRVIFYFPLIMPTHEAGHAIACRLVCSGELCEPFAKTINHFICIYNATFFQSLWPCIFFVYFLRHHQPKAADFCLFWLGISFTASRTYIADARELVLPLIGQVETGIPDIHDWHQMLDMLGWLEHDILISKIYYGVGCAFIALSIYCLIYHIKNYRPIPEAPFFKEW